MHKCFEDLKQQLEDRGYRDIEIPTLINFNTGQLMPYFLVKFKKVKKDGTLSKKSFDMPIVFTYCPFCGKKLEKEEHAKSDMGDN